jgi:hypothetical protein
MLLHNINNFYLNAIDQLVFLKIEGEVMVEKIDWTISAQVAGGPRVMASDSLAVEAYDKIEVTVPKNGSITVDLQPSNADHVYFLLIRAADKSMYSNLSHKPEDAPGAINLDAPLILIGNGAITLLTSTKKIEFFNSSTSDDAALSILVGRKAAV